MPSAYSDYVAPDYVDRNVVPFFGCDPAWTPDKEYIDPKHADFRGQAPCLHCGGDGVQVRDDTGEVVAVLTGMVERGKKGYCPRCVRYGLDARLPAPDKPPDPPKGKAVPVPGRPGYVKVGNAEFPERFGKLMGG